jgi:phosphatidylglycerophosphatase A
MLKPDFTKYSLALVQEDKIIYETDGSGLAPLWNCLENHRGAKDKYILFDKVIGLAAARLIVDSEIIAAIQTSLISQPAKQTLEENSIKIEADEVVANILRKDKSGVCPAELIALNNDNWDDFFTEIKTMLVGR